MTSAHLTEILAAHADQLNSPTPTPPDAFLDAFPDQRGELASLLELATRIKRTLTPVRPSTAFRERLHNGLLLAAHHQQAQRIYVEKRGEPQWGWLLGAAAAAGAAGLIAVVWRSRSQAHKAPVVCLESTPG